MSNYTDIKPLPYTTYDIIVHLMSGFIFTGSIFYIFSLLEPLRQLIGFENIPDSNIDDIFFLFVFIIISYSVGHIITSISSKLIQSNLDADFSRPFDHYFKDNKCYERKKFNPGFLVQILHFTFLTPLWSITRFRNIISNTYYDDFLSEDTKKEELRLYKAIDKHWDLSSEFAPNNNKQNREEPYAEAREFLKEKLAFHYIESLSKSHASHHSEFVYGHLIQYSFARNMAFVFSSTTMIIFILLGLNYFSMKCDSFGFIKFLVERSHHIVCLNDVKEWMVLFTILAICIFISISFFLRFLDQYKRYTREIYLAFVTEELKRDPQQRNSGIKSEEKSTDKHQRKTNKTKKS